ncbi:MAG TPA: hypothetical protein VIH84_01770 [Candidatus Methylomirabilis sp.]
MRDRMIIAVREMVGPYCFFEFSVQEEFWLDRAIRYSVRQREEEGRGGKAEG